jgi:molybdopterin converting factor small subunit
MRIGIKGFGFDPVQAFGEKEVNLNAEPATLQALLQELAEKNRERGKFFNPQSDAFFGEYEIQVNSCQLSALTQGLSTELNDGDEVEIIVSLGGG